MLKIENDWNILLNEEFEKPYFLSLKAFLDDEYSNRTIYPKRCDIFNALNITPFHSVKVVILGQDPYHGADEAHGLCFSVENKTKLPPSLKNIYKEIESDTKTCSNTYGNLTAWAEQGVLLLNSVLTVRENEPNSHKNCGWETFTDKIISHLNSSATPIIFLLWGNNAKSKQKLISNANHTILSAAHPSPLSAYHGFFGCKHFSKTNDILKALGASPIIW